MTAGRGTAAFALVDPAAAPARVGDPPDKPPAANRHILRIGVDARS